MKYFLHCVALVLWVSFSTKAQITSPIIKAAFGVDADLRANYFNGFVQSGNDDWFNNGTVGTGNFVMDTTGAAAMVAAYLSDVSPWPRRMASFYRTMSKPKFSIVNNRLWLDAMFIRDYHGNDSTVFSTGSKNGMSPANWSCPVAQPIPDKNDILDMFLHIRRAGPATSDSLWMFGGLSLDNTVGDRYFDFEMYQTDIYYNRGTQQWFGYGPDMGHTSWQFDVAGNVIKAGDIILTASYQSSTLTNIEARIWVNQNSLSIIPAQFNWSGQFDGASAGATYGYASILPKTAGTFYTGLGCGNNTWAGPFQLILQNNNMAVNYTKDQFMEFSVNLTKLGLDPVTTGGTDICGTPFSRVLVKTRSSASFTASLKDFIGPTDLFLAPRVDAAAEAPILCTNITTSVVSVINPHPTSVYTWTTPNGRIIGPTVGDSILVDSAGTYIVTQRLLAGCSPYATDTVQVTRVSDCSILPASFQSFLAALNNEKAEANLHWRVLNNLSVSFFAIEKSKDGIHFEQTGISFPEAKYSSAASYDFTDNISGTEAPFVYYRIRMVNAEGGSKLSRVVRLVLMHPAKEWLSIFPNPVRERFAMRIVSSTKGLANVAFFDIQGRQVMNLTEQISKGENNLMLSGDERWKTGTYITIVRLNQNIFYKRFLVIK